MSENQQEIENERVTIRIHINEIDAADLLRQFAAPFPESKEISEIHLIIEKE